MENTQRNKVIIALATITFLIVMIAVYCFVLATWAYRLIDLHTPAGYALASGILIVPIIGVWIIYSTIKSSIDIQHISGAAREAGYEIDTTGLARRPSGRYERADADRLFNTMKEEWEIAPDSWVTNYRLARAYDYAGDRQRARETMKRALYLFKTERKNS